MSGEPLVALYEQALVLSQAMREAAQRGLWDELLAVAQRRAPLMAEIEACPFDPGAEAVADRRIAALIRAILEADAETDQLTRSWMGELQGILSSVATEKRLQDAYNPG